MSVKFFVSFLLNLNYDYRQSVKCCKSEKAMIDAFFPSCENVYVVCVHVHTHTLLEVQLYLSSPKYENLSFEVFKGNFNILFCI